MSLCERKLSHICKHSPNSILIIYVNSYTYSTFLPSAHNDATLIWKYFRRNKCFNKDQIFIFGDLDIKNKCIPWRERYNLKLEAIDPKVNIYFYYSGHGYPDGRYDISNNVLKLISKDSICILDSCFSYLWNNSEEYIASTSEENALSLSTKKISLFTFDFIKYLLSENECLKEFIKINNYTLVTKDINEFLSKMK